jgi:hypothetical protein
MFALRLDPEDLRGIRAEAERLGVTQSQIVRQALAMRLNNEGTQRGERRVPETTRSADVLDGCYPPLRRDRPV